jgi:hypothetical protein
MSALALASSIIASSAVNTIFTSAFIGIIARVF